MLKYFIDLFVCVHVCVFVAVKVTFLFWKWVNNLSVVVSMFDGDVSFAVAVSLICWHTILVNAHLHGVMILSHE